MARHAFPVDGEYDFQIRLYRTNLSAIRGLEDPQELELLLDGERVHRRCSAATTTWSRCRRTPPTPRTRSRPRGSRSGASSRPGSATSPRRSWRRPRRCFEANRLQRFIRDFANPFDAEGAPHVQSITIQGPYNAKGVEKPVSAAAVRVPAQGRGRGRRRAPGESSPTLGRRAFRRPLSAAETTNILSFYREGRKDESFETGIQFALRRILASPSFVFRPEARAVDAGARATPYPVSDLELASRLSFFFWSTIPDEPLLRSAEQGRLRQPAELPAQVRRLLRDSRSAAFVSNFAGQWLHLRNLKGKVPNSDLFPDFDDNLRQAFRRETELFFESVVREDRSVLDLMTADYTFVNERLARHYGIPGVFGGEFRRVHAARRGAPGPPGQGRRPAGDLARQHDVAGAARQVGAGEHARRAAAGPARRSRHRAQARAAGRSAEHDAGADGAAPRQPGVRHLPPHHRPDRLRARELRRRRRVAHDQRGRRADRSPPTS